MRRAISFSALLLMCSCASIEDPSTTESSPLLSGDYTYDRPEVGSIRVGGGACTATLFATARTVITAAHCVDYRSSSGPGSYGEFTIAPRSGESYDYVIAQYHSFDSGGGGSEDDIAILQLAEPVPASVATPDVPAGDYPANGTTVTIYGYGCQERRSQSGPFEKQSFEFSWGSETQNLCPGDSGGPTLTPDGEVLGINSAYLIGPGTDLFGDVVRNLTALRDYVDRWAEGDVVRWIGEGGAEPDPMCATFLGCETCAATAGCGWCGTCVVVDESGSVAGGACTTDLVLSPEACMPDGGGGDGGGGDGGGGDGGGGDGGGDGGGAGGGDCAHLSDVTEFTCATDAAHFVLCGPGGLQFLVCPEGYYCPPGSRNVECLWGASGATGN